MGQTDAKGVRTIISEKDTPKRTRTDGDSPIFFQKNPQHTGAGHAIAAHFELTTPRTRLAGDLSAFAQETREPLRGSGAHAILQEARPTEQPANRAERL